MSVILTALVHRLKDWETALFVYEDLKNAGLKLSDIMVTNLLSAVGKSGKLDRLHKVRVQIVVSVRSSVSFLFDIMLRLRDMPQE